MSYYLFICQIMNPILWALQYFEIVQYNKEYLSESKIQPSILGVVSRFKIEYRI